MGPTSWERRSLKMPAVSMETTKINSGIKPGNVTQLATARDQTAWEIVGTTYLMGISTCSMQMAVFSIMTISTTLSTTLTISFGTSLTLNFGSLLKLASQSTMTKPILTRNDTSHLVVYMS